ncbi:uncharacterized protein LOC134186727 [Corticium candelabrum]|uniref:uncharacterized protein LOC134186727 n=1 Tax=Corticium candelabrum TaxID=121492 RepID=UPI002E2767E1|nr:uncharacterized protein LOC134186727 [Corticium candelabrum]
MKFLRKVVLDPKWLRSMTHYVRCRQTSALENYHNLILKYASKRIAFGYEASKACCLLAAMDHNEHTTLEQAITKATRQPRFHRKFNKYFQQWTVRKVKERKQYNHVTGIIHTITEKRMEEEESTHRHTMFLQQNPQHIAQTTAPVSPPSTADLAERQCSRTGTV